MNNVSLDSLVYLTHLMQFSGSFLQSVLHLNLSQVSHPIGGVRANPLSKEEDPRMRIIKERDSICHMLIPQMSC